ncbi:MAG: ankyrin repeat domain-containing protein [Allosphingosinicella sp.]
MDRIASADDAALADLLAATPALARSALKEGATRARAADNFLGAIDHHLYAGDTALHVAAAAYRADLARRLIGLGAPVSATNRRGATPLHYAADGNPQAPRWDPEAQSAVIAALIEAGADPNAPDCGGVTPLHRAVRGRCAAAVRALLDGGADARRENGSGSTPLMLATRQTGRGGSGSREAKAQQAEIVALLERRLTAV